MVKPEEKLFHPEETVTSGMFLFAFLTSFDPVFEPEGSDKTLAEEKPDEISARARAVEALVKDIPYAIVNPIFEWDGAYQE